MKRIDTATKAVDLFGAGKHGFTDGNPVGGVEPTDLNAAQFNHLQEEIARVIEGAGIALDAGSYEQLKAAIAVMIAGSPANMLVNSRAGAYTAVAGDKGKIIDCTTGSWTLGLTAAATLGAGWWAIARKADAGTTTVDPDGAETIDGAATVAIASGSWRLIVCTGAAFLSISGGSVTVVIPYDHPFNAGFNAILGGLDLAVQTYGEGLVGRAFTATGEVGDIRTPAVGADAIFDVEKNGVTIYTTKPKFAAAANALTAGVLKVDGTQIFAAGDRITFKCTQTGVATKGQKATFTLLGTVN